jgi:hypothetical protein
MTIIGASRSVVKTRWIKAWAATPNVTIRHRFDAMFGTAP